MTEEGEKNPVRIPGEVRAQWVMLYPDDVAEQHHLNQSQSLEGAAAVNAEGTTVCLNASAPPKAGMAGPNAPSTSSDQLGLDSRIDVEDEDRHLRTGVPAVPDRSQTQGVEFAAPASVSAAALLHPDTLQPGDWCLLLHPDTLLPGALGLEGQELPQQEEVSEDVEEEEEESAWSLPGWMGGTQGQLVAHLPSAAGEADSWLAPAEQQPVLRASYPSMLLRRR